MEQHWNDNNYDAVVESSTPIQTTPPENNNSSKDSLAIASLVLGIVGIFVNPLYLISVLAIIFGAIGMSSEVHGGKAKAGLILGIVGIFVQIVVDLILTIFTAGMGGVSFCC